MAMYMVGYDLTKPVQDYSGLELALKAYRNWWHHLDSTWIVETDDSADQVKNHLRQYLDKNDELLVAALGSPAAWSGFNAKGAHWLKGYLVKHPVHHNKRPTAAQA